MQTPLVTVGWLKDNLTDPDLIILDATIKMDASTFKDNPEQIRIPGARHFNFKTDFSDTSSSFPNMLASASKFEANSQVLGINKNSKLVVYDSTNIYTSPRVWWMFNTMGFENIAVLDGGLPEWLKQGNAIEEIRSDVYPVGDFTASFNRRVVKNLEFIKANIDSAEHLLIDARSQGRFEGTAPEPRAGLRSGCIPNSINIPFTRVLENGKMKNQAQLKEILKPEIEENKPFTFTCGSGVTACIVLLAMRIAYGKKDYSVYDGSWTEWATLMPV